MRDFPYLRQLVPLIALAVCGCHQKHSPATVPGPTALYKGAERNSANVPGSAATGNLPRPPAIAKADIEKAISRGVAFLKADQQPDGSWGTGLQVHGNEIYHMVPGSHDAYRVATTALATMAMEETGQTEAYQRGIAYLVRQGEARRDSGDMMYNIWAHIYATEALARALSRKDFGPTMTEAEIRAACLWQLDHLARYQTARGGWNYYDFEAHTQSNSGGATSFCTAAGLMALDEARRAGLQLPDKIAERAVRRLQDCRLPTGAYMYGADYWQVPRLPANRWEGSVGRAQASNLALLTWKSSKVTEAMAFAELEKIIAGNAWMEMGRKRPIPHESWFQTSGYYYYYGYYYAGRLAEHLGEAAKKRYGAELAGCIVPYQEADGSFWDYPMWDYDKPYGTAYAVMALLRVR